MRASGLRDFRWLPVALLAAGLGIPAPAAPPPSAPDLTGTEVQPLAGAGTRATVLLFVRTDCPIANRYAPEMSRLHAAFAGQGVAFWLVYVDPGESVEAVREHMASHGLAIPALRDVKHRLVHLAGATVTPEAAVFTAAGDLAYRGRIDDRFTDFGKRSAEPGRRDLQSALREMLEGKAVEVPRTRAVGCYIDVVDAG